MPVTTEIQQKITQHFNEEGHRIFVRYNAKHPENPIQFENIDAVEFETFLGHCFLKVVYSGTQESLRELWLSGIFSRPVFSATMSRDRFALVADCEKRNC